MACSWVYLGYIRRQFYGHSFVNEWLKHSSWGNCLKHSLMRLCCISKTKHDGLKQMPFLKTPPNSFKSTRNFGKCFPAPRFHWSVLFAFVISCKGGRGMIRTVSTGSVSLLLLAQFWWLPLLQLLFTRKKLYTYPNLYGYKHMFSICYGLPDCQSSKSEDFLFYRGLTLFRYHSDTIQSSASPSSPLPSTLIFIWQCWVRQVFTAFLAQHFNNALSEGSI